MLGLVCFTGNLTLLAFWHFIAPPCALSQTQIQVQEESSWIKMFPIATESLNPKMLFGPFHIIQTPYTSASSKKCFLEQSGKSCVNSESYIFNFLWRFQMYTEGNSISSMWTTSVPDHVWSFSQYTQVRTSWDWSLRLKVNFRKAPCVLHKPVLSSLLHNMVFTKIYGETLPGNFSYS